MLLYNLPVFKSLILTTQINAIVQWEKLKDIRKLWKYAAIEKNLKRNDGEGLTALKSSLFSTVCMYVCNWRSMAINSLISGLQYAWIRCKFKVWVFSPFLTVISSATTPRKASEIHATHIRKKFSLLVKEHEVMK